MGCRALTIAAFGSVGAVMARGGTIRVGGSSLADTRTVQAGVDLVPHGSKDAWSVLVEPGVYRERVLIPSDVGPLILQGLGPAAEVLLIHACPAGNGDGTRGCTPYPAEPACAPLDGADANSAENLGATETLLVLADDFVLRNLTVANDACGYDHRRAGQSQAAQLLGDRAVVSDSAFLGGQDTLYTGGRGTRSYYLRTFINGSVDSIYGSGSAVFQDCDLTIVNHVTAHSGDPNGGGPGLPGTYLFQSCYVRKPGPDELDFGALDGHTDLGRPWCHPLACALNVVFKYSWMDSHIRPEGWIDHMGGDGNGCEKFSADECAASSDCHCQNITYAEYANKGPGAAGSGRAPWSRQLSELEAHSFTVDKVLRGWKPMLFQESPEVNTALV